MASLALLAAQPGWAQCSLTTSITPSGSASFCGGGSVTLTASANVSSSGYSVTSIPYAPLTVTNGNPGPTVDDQVMDGVSLGMPFTYYGTSYTTCSLSPNGNIQFLAAGSNDFTPDVIPNTATANNIVALCWTDLNPATGGTISYATVGTAPNRKFVVYYDNLSHYGTATTAGPGTFTGQMILYEGSNAIEFHILNEDNTTKDHAVGLENFDGTDGIAAPNRNAGPWTVTAPEAWRFTPNLGGTVSYSWSPTTGLSNPNIANPVASPTATTVYTVTATSTMGCVGTAQQTVTVATRPTVATTTPGSRCGTGTVVLQATGATGSMRYVWYDVPTGGAAIGVLTTPSFTTPVISTTTTFYVLIRNGPGCESQRVPVVATVNPQPPITVTASTTALCGGATSTLTGGGAGTGGTYQFLFNNQLVTNTTATTLVASQPGAYAVIGTNSNGCADTATITLTTAPAPAAPTATPASRCGSGTVTLVASGAPAGATYRWYTVATGGTPIAGATTASYTTPSLAATTTYYVSVLNGGCESSRTSVTATITPGPAPTLTAGGPTTLCSGNTVTLTAGGGGTGATYQFLLNGSPIPGATGTTYQAAQAGTYTVSASIGTCTGTSTAAVSVTVTPAPAAPTATPASRCGSGTVTLVASGAPTGATYRWYTVATGGTPIAGATTASYTTPSLAATTTYYVSAINGTCESPRTSVTATINAAPAPTITATGPTTVCGGTVALTAAGGGTGAAYQFLLNGSPIAGATGTTYNAAQSGTYTVSATAGTCSGVSATPVTVTITPAPAAPTATPASRCGAGTLTLTAAGAPAGATYRWYTVATGGTPIAGATTASYTTPSLAATTTYYVSVLNGTCESSRTSVAATINAAPAPTLTAGGPIALCQGSAVVLTATGGGTGATYQFLLNGSPISGATGTTYSASQAGTYSVQATAGTCTGTSTATVAITVTPTPAAPTATPASRCGSGTVTLVASGAPTGATYRWYTVATGGTPIAGATTASYTTPSLAATTTYYVSAINGTCESPRTSVTATINAAPAPTLAAGGPTTICQGATLVLTAAGGGTGATYQFLLNGSPISGATGTTYSATQAGAYTVQATAGTCSATSTAVNVTVNPQPSAAFAYSSSTLCLSGPNAVPVITGATGGTFSATPAGLTLNTNTGAITLGSSTAGTYLVRYSVGGTCPAFQTQTITLTSAPSAAFSYPTTGTLCSGAAATLAPTLGTGASAGTFSAPAGLTINPQSGIVNLATSAAGTYTVTNTIAASGSCSASSATASVTVSAAPTASISHGSAPLTFCQGDSVVLTATGGTSYQYLLNGSPISGATAATYIARQGGSYTVTATNAAGCSATSAPMVVTVNPAQSAAFAYSGTTFCLSGTNPTPTVTGTTGGQFSATPSGLNLNPATGAINLASSQSGSYTVTYTTAGPCAATTTQAITLSTSPSAAFSYASAGCAGTTGTLLPVLGTGAAAGVFSSTAGLTINAGTGEVNLATSAAGTYTVTNTIAASGACPAANSTATLTINAAPTAGLTAGGATTLCAGDSVTLTATGGTSYQYLLNGSPISGATGATYVASQAGSYTVAVSNAAGCSATSAPVAVTINTAPTAGLTASGATTLCAGDSVMLTATGGTSYQYLLYGSPISGATASTLMVHQAGDYSVRVSNAAGCSTTSSVVAVTVNAAPTAALVAAGPTTFCSGDTVSLTASGGTAYQFYRDGVLIVGATSATYQAWQNGSYTALVTNAAGCSATSAPVSVTVNPPQAATFSYGTTAICLSGTNPTPLVTGTAGGVFAASGTGLILDPATGEINLAASTSGTYQVSYTTAGPCAASDTVTLTLSTAPSAAFSYASAGCGGTAGTLLPVLGTGAGTGVFSSTAGLTIDAATGEINLATSAAGTYTVTNTIAASGTCAAVTATATVTINAAPTAGLTAGGATTLCAGDSVTLTATGGTSYQYLLNGSPITGATGATYVASQAGSYTVAVSNAAGCSATSSAVAVTVSAAPTAGLTASGATTICAGSSVTLTATGGTSYQYLLNGSPISGATAATYSATQAGSYTVAVSNAAGCSATSAAVAVTVNAAPSAGLTAGGATTICAGSSVVLTATGGTSYQYLLNGSPISGATTATYSATQAGSYTVAVSNAAGCSDTSAAVAVTVSAAPTAGLTTSAATFCQGDSVTLTATGGTSYQFYDGVVLLAGGANGVLSVNQAGSYTVVVSNAAGCSATSSAVTVTMNAAPAAPSITQAPFGVGLVQLTATGTGAVQWYFNGAVIPGATGNTYVVSTSAQSGAYTATVSATGTGCVSPPSAGQTVTVTGLGGVLAGVEAWLVPNPTADGQVELQLAGLTHGGQVTVLDATGRRVLLLPVSAGTNRLALDLRALPTGVYAVRLTTPAGSLAKRLVRE